MMEETPSCLEQMEKSSCLNANNSAYLANLYDQYLKDPTLVSSQWQDYFAHLSDVGENTQPDIPEETVKQHFVELAKQPTAQGAIYVDNQQEQVDKLITAYRLWGHLQADLDPLGKVNLVFDPRLDLKTYQLSCHDDTKEFFTRGVLKQRRASLRAILDHLRQAYCQKVGFEFAYISSSEQRTWLEQYIENQWPTKTIDPQKKICILKDLIASHSLEHYLSVKYPGQRRFSIEGVDVLIPALNTMVLRAREDHLEEVVLGMAHRGRLNVVVNTLGKPTGELFDEFSGKHEHDMTTGDAKYHLGYSADIQTQAGSIHVSMLFNPSHLEHIDPVLLGSVRARQDRYANKSKRHQSVLAIMIHGDAAFSAQGVVAETLAMSKTRAYNIGGTLHIVTNNQIGFTTENPADARSSRYCTGLAQSIEAPVIHVNADDVESVVKVMDLAYAYRQTFQKDIVVDIVGYRRHGHQEVDEPRATQPLEYQIIQKHLSVHAIYTQQLIDAQVVSQDQVRLWVEDYRQKLDQGVSTIDVVKEGVENKYRAIWEPYLQAHPDHLVITAVSKKTIQWLNQRLQDYPKHYQLLKQVDQIMQHRDQMAQGQLPMDWGFAETMAYACLVNEGISVRFSGEDSQRGTFFHRHAVLHDQKTGEQYTPLAHISPHQASFEIYNSLLAELGPLGFEYGYSTACPNALVIWEAQFGDFANTAQVIIDQFISSAWQKWRRLSGLVLFLPHGYEGMGPEHSSARLERYLQLCAQKNMQVCVPSTPAQIFHLLRRQVIRPFRYPLIVMTPKSLLRHKLAVSSLSDLTSGSFYSVIPEIDKEEITPFDVKRIVLCSGRIYYDLLQKRRENQQKNIALIRIEQLYPFPYDEVKTIFAHYPNALSICWCQEEPKNQGSWYITQHRLMRCLDKKRELMLSSRPAMAAPASGYSTLNTQQQIALVDLALNLSQKNQK